MNQTINGDVPNTSKASGASIYEEYLLESARPKKVRLCERLTLSQFNPLSWISSLLPILKWLPKYNFRRDLSYDLIAGMTVCVMQIPQGMAYALLANVQPVVGIYMAFFPIIVYSIMGTSRHISMGTFAVTCLMTGKTVAEIHAKYTTEQPSLNDTSLGTVPYEFSGDNKNDPVFKYTPEQIATVVSLVTGLIQILMGTFQLGFLCVLLSSDLVGGFTTGAAVHVFTSQVKNLLGLSLKRRTGIFKIPLAYYDIFSNIANSNVTAIIISVITLSFLIIYNEVLKPRVAKKISIPIPIELLTIVTGTLVSKYWITSKKYGIPIVDTIPTGFPAPAVPPLELIQDVIVDSLVLAIVAYTIAISMAKIFATKHSYEVGPNQELLANGTSNVVGCFFSCAPISCSLSRSVIQEQVGGKSQLASLVGCGIIIFVLLWIAPFFETLPHCVLSSMIVVALKGMFMQLLDIPKAIRESPLNFTIWLATFVSTIVLDIEYGLGIGVFCAILSLIWRSNMPLCQLLAVHLESDGSILVCPNSPKAKIIPGVKIIKFTGALNFATCEHFAKKMQKLIPPVHQQITDSTLESSMLINANAGRNSTFRHRGHRKGSLLDGMIVSVISEDDLNPSPEFGNSSEELYKSTNTTTSDISQKQLLSSSSGFSEPEPVRWIVLDLSSVSSIDPAAAKGLVSLVKLYLRKDMNIIFAGCAPSLIETMDRSSLLKVAGMDHFHPSVPAALNFLRRGLVVRRRSSISPIGPAIPPPFHFADRATEIEEIVEDDGEIPVVGDTTAYFRRLSKTSLR